MSKLNPFCRLFLLAICLLISIPARTQTIYCVSAQSLNFRSAPSTVEGRVFGQLAYGTQVTVSTTIDGRWVLAEYNGQRGYLSSRYLRRDCIIDVASTSATTALIPVNNSPDANQTTQSYTTESPASTPRSERAITTTVLICDSRAAYAYHRGWCRGLNQCRSEVYEVSRERAQAMGRKACGFCY